MSVELFRLQRLSNVSRKQHVAVQGNGRMVREGATGLMRARLGLNNSLHPTRCDVGTDDYTDLVCLVYRKRFSLDIV